MKIGSAALFIHLSLKLLEGLLGGRGLQNLEGIEANSLGQGSAFTDNDGIPDLKRNVFKIKVIVIIVKVKLKIFYSLWVFKSEENSLILVSLSKPKSLHVQFKHFSYLKCL